MKNRILLSTRTFLLFFSGLHAQGVCGYLYFNHSGKRRYTNLNNTDFIRLRSLLLKLRSEIA